MEPSKHGETRSKPWYLWRRRGGALDARPPPDSGSAALSIEETPKARACAPDKRAGAFAAARRRCPRWLVAVLLGALAAVVLGAGVVVGHVVWPRTVDRVEPVPGFLSRPVVVTSAVRATRHLALPCLLLSLSV